MIERNKKFCVCCPICGRINARSEYTNTEIICKKCKTEFVAQIDGEKIITFVSRRKDVNISS